VQTDEYDYCLPDDFIAQRPAEPRDASRLMILDRASGDINHTYFNRLPEFLHPGDTLVVNETRVLAARLMARKVPSGGKVELLLLRRLGPQNWEVLVGGRGLKTGSRLAVIDGPQAEVIEVRPGGRRVVHFDQPISGELDRIGEMPLPPYIHEPLADPSEYQTVYASVSGSAAAPTAGLHFTPALLEGLEASGVRIVKVVLHVGLDTFQPVTEADPREHVIHSEWCRLTAAAASAINQAKRDGRRVIAVGTTTTRTLETAGAGAGEGQAVAGYEGATNLYILPGYTFKVIDALITNFHLPRSTLLMMVSAFAGRERILAAYEAAKQNGYRFYSFGDAMLIL
jgi:S-adenosylmethionine:tRNA ribosyltransferase-isomerase